MEHFCKTVLLHVILVLHGHCFPQHGEDKRTSGVTELFTNATNQLYECKHPKYFQIQFNLYNGVEITLNLRRYDTSSNKYPPTFLLSRLSRQETAGERSNQEFVRYASTVPDSRILVECQRKQKSNLLYISGVILYQGRDYVIQTFKPEEISTLGIIFVRWHRISEDRHTHDYIVSEKSRLPPSQISVTLSRERRDVRLTGDHIHTFTVDVLAVVDNSVYLKWFSDVGRGTDQERSERAKNEIQKYYHHVINGVDLRYQSIGFADFQVRVNLSGIIIIDNNTHTHSPNTTHSNELDADTALKRFRTWVNDTSGLPAHNHAILFTGYDLYTTKGNKEKIGHTSGLAFIGTLCEPSDSVSIVEEKGGFQSIGTAAHEIGHSLGALHDGENNTCHSEDRYIMAASGFGPVPEDKKYNPWIFSPCTVEYFRDYISSLVISGSNCLANKSVAAKGKEDQSAPPGQHYSPDEQCRQIWGPTSYLCRGAEFGDASTICTAMYCRDPSTESDCVLHTATRGTSCGNKRWCMNGHCVYSTRAPRRQEPCVLGDQPGPAFNSMTCAELIAESPSYCYQEKVRARCCNTCWANYTYRKGCEYGDRIQGCRLWHCSHFFESRDIQSECCGTCGIGEFVTTSDPNQLLLPEDTSLTVSPAVWNPDTCTDTGKFSGLSCAEYIRSRGPFVCYSNMTAEVCCQSCRRLHSQTKGCEYGDRVPSLCANIQNRTELTCAKYGDICCDTCISLQITSSASNSLIFCYTWLLSLSFICLVSYFELIR